MRFKHLHITSHLRGQPISRSISAPLGMTEDEVRTRVNAASRAFGSALYTVIPID